MVGPGESDRPRPPSFFEFRDAKSCGHFWRSSSNRGWMSIHLLLQTVQIRTVCLGNGSCSLHFRGDLLRKLDGRQEGRRLRRRGIRGCRRACLGRIGRVESGAAGQIYWTLGGGGSSKSTIGDGAVGGGRRAGRAGGGGRARRGRWNLSTPTFPLQHPRQILRLPADEHITCDVPKKSMRCSHMGQRGSS